MFPWYPAYVLWMVPLIVIAVVGGILARRRVTLELVALTAVMGLAFRFWEGLTDLFDSTPVWNLRLLPFWYFGLLLLAMLGEAEHASGAASLETRGHERMPAAAGPDAPTPGGRDRTRDDSIMRAVTIALVTVLIAGIAIWRVYDTTGFITFWAKCN